MKIQYIIFLLLSFLLSACNNKETHSKVKVTHLDSGFSIYEDTLFVDIKGEMTHALKFQNKYYVLFEQKILEFGGYGKRWLSIFSDGELEKTVNCPASLQTTYLDFFVKNDSIILKPYMNNKVFYLDTKDYTWRNIKQVDDLIFEDEKYNVYSLDFGEWGGKTWFRDKKTNIEYVVAATTPLINKIDSTYYLSSTSMVLKITNPTNLYKCKEEFKYEDIVKSRRIYAEHEGTIGYDAIYYDIVTFNPTEIEIYKPKPKIITSFVVNNELFHLFTTDTINFVGKIENNSAKPITEIVNGFQFFNQSYSYRFKNKFGNELLKFKTTNEHLFGLVEIIENNIHIHYFYNKAELSPKIIGQTKSDEIFEKRLDLYLSNLKKLKLENVEAKELSWGSFDITPNHVIGIDNAWNPKRYPIDKNKSFLLQEDSVIKNSVLYFGTKSNDLVRSITIDWKTNKRKAFSFTPSEKSQDSQAFKNKFSHIESQIIKRIGKPNKINETEEIKERYWKTSTGLCIELKLTLTDNYKEIRFVIYPNK